MKSLAPGLWTSKYPLTILGTNHGRTVTVIRLSSGKVIVHSMAPFTSEDLAEIRDIGQVAWLVEAMLLHDTYAGEGPNHFPGIPFLGPPGFGGVVGLDDPVLRAGFGSYQLSGSGSWRLVRPQSE